MYKAVKKTKVILRYTESLALHTVAPILHWKDNTSCISIFESKRITPRVKHIDITVFCTIKNWQWSLYSKMLEV